MMGPHRGLPERPVRAILASSYPMGHLAQHGAQQRIVTTMELERELATRLLEAHPRTAAAALESLSNDEIFAVLADAPAAATALVLRQIAPQVGSEVLGRMSGPEAEEVVNHLGFDDAADLIRRLPPDRRSRFVAALTPSSGTALEALVAFPPDTAGVFMDSTVLALPEDVTVSDAVDRIRKSPGQVRYNLYVVDRGGRLVGVLNLRELLLAERKQTLGDIARREVLSIQADANRSLILGHPAWREAHSLPVVDGEGTYLGAIRYRTWRLLEEEAVQRRARRDTTTADALGDLLATGVAGAAGAFTDLASRATRGRANDDG